MKSCLEFGRPSRRFKIIKPEDSKSPTPVNLIVARPKSLATCPQPPKSHLGCVSGVRGILVVSAQGEDATLFAVSEQRDDNFFIQPDRVKIFRLQLRTGQPRTLIRSSNTLDHRRQCTAASDRFVLTRRRT